MSWKVVFLDSFLTRRTAYRVSRRNKVTEFCYLACHLTFLKKSHFEKEKSFFSCGTPDIFSSFSDDSQRRKKKEIPYLFRVDFHVPCGFPQKPEQILVVFEILIPNCRALFLKNNRALFRICYIQWSAEDECSMDMLEDEYSIGYHRMIVIVVKQKNSAWVG